MDRAVIGARVRALRQKRRLRQKDVAVLAKVAVGTVQGLEYGERETGLSQFERIAKALGTTTAMLEGPNEAGPTMMPNQVSALKRERLVAVSTEVRVVTPAELRLIEFLRERPGSLDAVLQFLRILTPGRSDT